MLETSGHLTWRGILQLSEHFDDTLINERPSRGPEYTQAHSTKGLLDFRWKACRSYCKEIGIEDNKDYYKWWKCRQQAALDSRSSATRAYQGLPTIPNPLQSNNSDKETTEIEARILRLDFINESHHHKHLETALSSKKSLSSEDRAERLQEECQYRSYMIATAVQRPLHQLATGEYSFDDDDYSHQFSKKFSKRFSRQSPDADVYRLTFPEHRKDGDAFYDLVYGIYMRSYIDGYEWTLDYLAAAARLYGGPVEREGLADFVVRFKRGQMPEGWTHDALELEIDISTKDWLEGKCGDESLFGVYAANMEGRSAVAEHDQVENVASAESTMTKPMKPKAAHQKHDSVVNG